MKHPIYVQIFSITDHAKPLHGHYEGQYQGNNAELQTSEVENGTLKIASQSKLQDDVLLENFLDGSKIVLAYRHSDTGVLSGTSETLFSISETPWEKMPGLLLTLSEENEIIIKLWSQEMRPKRDQVYRIHFGKTVVYLKNFGPMKKWELTDKILSDGPSQLHSKDVHQNISIAPDAGSGLQIKMGQETQNS